MHIHCHATDGQPKIGPARPSTVNFVAIDGPAGLSTGPWVVQPSMDGPPHKLLLFDVPSTFHA